MFSKVLCGVDGSEPSMRAAKTAAELAQKFGSHLIYLTVTKEFRLTDEAKQYVELEQLSGEPQYVLEEYAENCLREAVRTAKDMGVANVRKEIKTGNPARTIVHEADLLKADCIVIGGRGLGDIGSILLGSVSHKVTSLAKCTVVTVR